MYMDYLDVGVSESARWLSDRTRQGVAARRGGDPWTWDGYYLIEAGEPCSLPLLLVFGGRLQ